MPRDSRQKSAEFHLRAAYAQLAPTQQARQEHQAGHEQSRQALEHSAKAFSESREARQKSANPRRRNKSFTTREKLQVMTAETFGIRQSFRVFGFGADGTARFFSLPSEAIITIVAESAVSGCVQILYDHELYITFKRNLMLHLKRERDLTRTTG
jgi:hypothetical protein